MQAVGIIPARFASTRLPEKMLIEVNGKSIIQMTYESANKSKKISDLIIAVDDKKLFNKVNMFSKKVVMTDPKCPSGTDRIISVAKDLDADIFINIQGDEPLISAEDIDRLVDAFKDEKVDIATLYQEISEKQAQDQDIVKVVFDKDDFALYFSRSKIPFDRDKKGCKFYKHIGIYAYRKEALFKFGNLPQTDLEKIEKLEQLRALQNGFKIKVLKTENQSVSIDVISDIDKLKNMLEGRKNNG